MSASGAVLILTGALVLAQLLKGNALQRLGVLA